MSENKIILEPPDGGWAWVVCFAYALGNFIYIPILQNFGLIFKNTFPKYGINATDGSIIINLNSAFGMLMGLINGSLLIKYGYRKISVAGGLIISFGLILTAFAKSFHMMLITYSIITSIGFGLVSSALNLALNSFFKEKRGIAMGYAWTATGLGPIIMPLFVSYLLEEYDITGVVLLVGAISLNTLVSASLLQPLKWHMKKKYVIIENKEENMDDTKVNLLIEDDLINREIEKTENNINKIGMSTLSINYDNEAQSIYGFGTPLPMRKFSVSSNTYEYEMGRQAYRRSVSCQDRQTPASVMSSKSSIYCSAENDLHKSMAIIEDEHENDIEETEEKKQSALQHFLRKCVTIFDLTLLKDPIYLNLMIGMSIAICAEINFGLFTPFILNDMNFSTFQIAQVMSTIATTDIIFRFIAPFVAAKLKFTARVMYLLSLVLLITTRSVLIFVTTFREAIMVACVLGLAKGFRTVFVMLLIPNYVPLERLAAASGIQMLVNGVIIMINGPIIGKIRDVTGSYNNCIIVINCLTFFTCIMWTVEILYFKYKNRKSSNAT